MKSRLVVVIVLLLLLTGLLVAILAESLHTVEASEARQMLEASLAQIEVPGPGHIVHYSYTLYERRPPSDLEPSDPYHLPYEGIWPDRQFEETWVEIGSTGKTVRWRTQLRSAGGELLQDLMFDGTVETDFFPKEGTATRITGQVSDFRDNRVTLIEDFLQNEELSHRENYAIDGRPVLSVYTARAEGSAWPTQRVEEALLSFTRPFAADLQPASRASRIDFHPSTLLPVGTAEVVWNPSGVEHIVSYRAFSDVDVLPASAAQVETIFHQEIPDQAFQNSFSMPARVITGLAQIAEQVNYPVYVLHDPPNTLHLAAASLALPDPAESPPGFMRGIEFAPALGTGIQLIYTDQDNTASLVIVQGPAASMRNILRQTRPTWIQAERTQLQLGPNQVTAWSLTGPQSDRSRYVVETGETILYIESRSLPSSQVLDLLEALRAID